MLLRCIFVVLEYVRSMPFLSEEYGPLPQFSTQLLQQNPSWHNWNKLSWEWIESPTGWLIPRIPIDWVCLVQGKTKKEKRFFHMSSSDVLKKWKQGKCKNNNLKKKNFVTLFKLEAFKKNGLWGSIDFKQLKACVININMQPALCLGFLSPQYFFGHRVGFVFLFPWKYFEMCKLCDTWGICDPLDLSFC